MKIKWIVSGIIIVVLFGISVRGVTQDNPAISYALHGPYWVGTTELMLEDDLERPLALTVWYPALNPDGDEEATEYLYYYPPVWSEREAITGRALLDAAPDTRDAGYPLVIFSHAMAMYRIQSSYLTEHLASYGFVVIALDHWQGTPEYAESMLPHTDYVYRPQDISRLIDFADMLNRENGLLVGMIDTDNVAVTGVSSGGLVALQMAGAQINLGEMRASCAESFEDGFQWFCSELFYQKRDELALLAGLDAAPEGDWLAVGDVRVDAIVPIVPGARLFGAASLEAITTPTMILLAGEDAMLDTTYHGEYVYEHLGMTPRAQVTLEGAGHFFGMDSCERTPFFVDVGLEWLCSDPAWDMDRAHDLVNHFTTAFLLDTLKGDAEAHAVLAPAAVDFVGVTYQAEGY